MFILDTSAVLNLLGSSAASRLLRGLASPCVVEERAIKELMYHPIPDRDITLELGALVADGLLETVRMTEAAYDVYVELAAVSGVGGLGVGESAAIAVAQEAGGIVVLDDRKARKRVEASFPGLEFVSSTRLFLQASASPEIPVGELRSIFLAAQANACMGILKTERDLVAHLNLFD